MSLDGLPIVIGPAVVHNNFIIGLHAKRMRFARYGLWSLGELSLEGGRLEGGYLEGYPEGDETLEKGPFHVSFNVASDGVLEGSLEGFLEKDDNTGNATTPFSSSPSSSSLFSPPPTSMVYTCGHDALDRWKSVFASVHKDIRIPTLSMVLPVHDAR